MTEQKHYNYEGSVDLKKKPKVVEVLDVSFLTPARVKSKVDGKEFEITVGVDLINRKIYENNDECQFSDKIFEYLDSVNSLPENFFEAPEDIYNQAADAKHEHESVKNRMSDDWEPN